MKIYCIPDITVVGTILNVFSYEATLHRKLDLKPPRQRADAIRYKVEGIGIICYLEADGPKLAQVVQEHHPGL